MQTSYLKAITLIMLATLSACCLSYECDYGSGSITLRLMRNDKNALYGPDAFLSKDDVKYIQMVGTMKEEGYIEFNDSLKTIELFVFVDSPAILEIEGISNDTISITSELVSRNSCCDTYQITSALRNGEVICEGRCEEIIDIEI